MFLIFFLILPKPNEHIFKEASLRQGNEQQRTVESEETGEALGRVAPDVLC